ncbi:MAG: YfhO family protein [Chloroflexota bacterium]
MFLNPIFLGLSAFLPTARVYNWLAVIHLFLAGFFTYILLREMEAKPFGTLVGSLAFAFNGYLVGWLAIRNVADTMVWLPLTLWGIERALKRKDWRWTIAGAMSFAIQIFSGFILWPFYGAITLLLLALYRSLVTWRGEKNIRHAVLPIFYTILTLGAGTLLAAPQLLPTIQLYFLSQRSEPLGASSYLDLKFALLRLVAPLLQGNAVRGNTYLGPFNYAETDLYFGVLPLFFLFASLRSPQRKLAWGFFGIGAISLLAVTNIPPFRQIVAAVYPIFLNTFPGRIYYVVAFTWSIAAGLGADWLLETGAPRRIAQYTARFLMYTALFLALICAILWVLAKQINPANSTIKFLANTYPQSLLAAVCWLAITILVFWALSRTIPKVRLIRSLSLVTIVAELFILGINYNSTYEIQWAFPKTPSLEFLENLDLQESEPYRLLNVNSGQILLGNTPALYRLQTLSGYSPWVLQRYAAYMELTKSRVPAFNHVYFFDCCQRLLDAMNIKYLYLSKDTPLSDLGVFDFGSDLNQAQVDPQSYTSVSRLYWTVAGKQQPVIYQHPPSRISYTLHLEKQATLSTAITIDSQAWDKPGDGVLFEIYLQPATSGTDVLLFSKYIDPKNQPADRSPTSIEVDLSPYSGQTIQLSFVTSPGPKGNLSYDWAGWVDPHIENFKEPSLKLVYDGPNKVYENLEALPRAWIVHSVMRVAPDNIKAIKTYLNNPKYNPATQAIVESNDPINHSIQLPAKDRKDYKDSACITKYQPERVEIDAFLDAPGLLILSDIMYPGWRAYVDGVETPILTTNLIMRGVLLTEGQHRVIFKYIPNMLFLGIIIACTASAIIIAILALTARNQ